MKIVPGDFSDPRVTDLLRTHYTTARDQPPPSPRHEANSAQLAALFNLSRAHRPGYGRLCLRDQNVENPENREPDAQHRRHRPGCVIEDKMRIVRQRRWRPEQ